MTGKSMKFQEYLENMGNSFAIPVYQRNYDWKIEHCKQLYDDLIKVAVRKRKTHFFGSLVSVFNPEVAVGELLVIDGQQRLTTVSLLLLAVQKLLTEKKISSEQDNLAETIQKQYLVDRFQNNQPKLKPVKNDFEAYQRFFQFGRNYVLDSKITINFKYFYGRIQQEEISVDELLEAIGRLEIICIMLKTPDDEPQLIFESLNSTGLALSEGDKVRNYILMVEESRQQEEYYNSYWNPIEIACSYEVTTFLRDYLTIKLREIPSFQHVYHNFKEFVQKGDFTTKGLLEDMFQYAKRYEILLQGSSAFKNLSPIIHRLNHLEATVARPFFLEVLTLWEDSLLNETEVETIFRTIEHYLFRRTICSLPTNSLNKIFIGLQREIYSYEGNYENYLEKFNYALLSKKGKTEFPTDNRFAEGFSSRLVYQMSSKHKTYLLERLENKNSKEISNIYQLVAEKKYTIEHIMPQTLTAEWIQDLGENYKEIHETWLDRVGNLTLTGYNGKLSNHSFQTKKTMKDGYLATGIRLNQVIAQKDKWGETELKERNENLTQQALEQWWSPKTSFIPREDFLERCFLGDEIEFNGKSLRGFSFRGGEQESEKVWISMFERVIRYLYRSNMSILDNLAVAEEGELSWFVSDHSDGVFSPLKLEEGIFIDRHNDTAKKINILQRLFVLHGEDVDNLIFYFKTDKEDDNKNTAERFEYRRKYWDYTLEKLHKVHGDGCFSKINSSKDRAITATFGVSGLCLNCIVGYDKISVELYFGKRSKDENKQFFDYLLNNKQKIETELNSPLVWQWDDQQISSKIFIDKEGIDLKNQGDWEEMAQFHCDWSEKFNRVLVPYLLNNL